MARSGQLGTPESQLGTPRSWLGNLALGGNPAGQWPPAPLSLAATGVGAGRGTAALTVERLLDGRGAGQGTALAALDTVAVVRLAGTGAGRGRATASLTVERLLTGAGDGAGEAAAALLVARLLAAAGTGRGPGRATPSGAMAAVGIGRGRATADLTVLPALRARGVGHGSGTAALTVVRALGARGVGYGRAHDGYTGPGSGLVTGSSGDLEQFLAGLEPGDTFAVVIPSGGFSGRTALARVLAITLDQSGRPSYRLQIEDYPTFGDAVAMDTATVPRYQPPQRTSLARRLGRAGRG